MTAAFDRPALPSSQRGWSRPGARAAALEDITRVFLAGAPADGIRATHFSDIASALIPLVSASAAVKVAAMLAGRDDVPAPVLAALAERGLRPRGSRAARPSRNDGPASPAPPNDGGEDSESSERPAPMSFLAADPAERQRLIADATRFAALDSGPELRRRLDSVTLLALDRAAARQDREDILAILARTLATAPDALAPLFDDPAGDALAILLRAAGLEEDGARRILIGAAPKAARTGSGLRLAMDTFLSIDRPAAVRLVAAMTAQPWRARADIPETAGTAAEPRRAAASAATISPSLTRETGGRADASREPSHGLKVQAR